MVIDLIPRNLEQNIFELVTQVLNKNTYLAIQIYRDLLLQKEEPIKVNAILLGQFRLLLQVKLLSKNGYQQTDITKVLKVHPYRVKLAFQQVRHLSEKVLADAFQGLVETEYNMTICLLYSSPSPRDRGCPRMPSASLKNQGA